MESGTRSAECFCHGRRLHDFLCLSESFTHLHGIDSPGRQLCYRRDEEKDAPGSQHFNYFGKFATNYLIPCTRDPQTWDKAPEQKIWENYKDYFSLDIKGVQETLKKAGYYKGDITGTIDSYTREAILIFQRSWGLIQNGSIDPALCRALSFITATIEII